MGKSPGATFYRQLYHVCDYFNLADVSVSSRYGVSPLMAKMNPEDSSSQRCIAGKKYKYTFDDCAADCLLGVDSHDKHSQGITWNDRWDSVYLSLPFAASESVHCDIYLHRDPAHPMPDHAAVPDVCFYFLQRGSSIIIPVSICTALPDESTWHKDVDCLRKYFSAALRAISDAHRKTMQEIPSDRLSFEISTCEDIVGAQYMASETATAESVADVPSQSLLKGMEVVIATPLSMSYMTKVIPLPATAEHDKKSGVHVDRPEEKQFLWLVFVFLVGADGSIRSSDTSISVFFDPYRHSDAKWVASIRAFLASVSLPRWTDDTCIASYIPTIESLMEDACQQKMQKQMRRANILHSLIEKYGRPSEIFNGNLLLNGVSSNESTANECRVSWKLSEPSLPLNYVLLMKISAKFPDEMPDVYLQSQDHMVQGTSDPVRIRFTKYPYSATWDTSEMVRSLSDHVHQSLSQFLQWAITKSGRTVTAKESEKSVEKTSDVHSVNGETSMGVVKAEKPAAESGEKGGLPPPQRSESDSGVTGEGSAGGTVAGRKPSLS